MNYRGKMQQGGPIDPKVLEQMNRYRNGMSGDIIERKPQLGAVKHQDPEEVKKNKQAAKYKKLRAVGYTHEEARPLSLHDKTLPSAQDRIDKMEATNHRISMHPDYNPNIPFEQQTDLLNDNSLRTRILRGRNEFMNSSSGNGIIDFLAKGIASPGSSFANLTMDAENQYVKPGLGQGLFNLGIDLLNVAPTETVGLANKSINTVKEVINKSTENGILSNAHKLNPFAFKPNSDKFYRTLGEQGFNDAKAIGLLRANPQGANVGEKLGNINMSRPSDVAYFAKGEIGNYPGADYVAETSKKLYARGDVNPITNQVIKGRHAGFRNIDELGKASNLPIEEVRLLKKDWLKGYKEVPQPISAPKSKLDSIIEEARAIYHNDGVKPLSTRQKALIDVHGEGLAKNYITPQQIKKNLEDLQYTKQQYEKFGYDIPNTLEEIAKNSKLTDETIQGLVNQHNTFARGVSTNWDELQKRNPEILRHLEGKGIDWQKDPKAAAEYMATHIPINTGYGRAGLDERVFGRGMDGLYTSNSIPTAEGYTYGDGFIVKAKRPTDFSSSDRREWINKNSLDYYDNYIPGDSKENLERLLNSRVTDQRRAFTDNLSGKNREIALAKLDEFEAADKSLRQKYNMGPKENGPFSIDHIVGRKLTDADHEIPEISKLWKEHKDKNVVPYQDESTKAYEQMFENLKKELQPEVAAIEKKLLKTEHDTNPDLSLLQRTNDFFGKRPVEESKKFTDYLKKHPYTEYDNKMLKLGDKLNNLSWDAQQPIREKLLNMQSQRTKLYNDALKEYFSKNYPEFDMTERYAHYIHLGTPGQKILEPLESIRITPSEWKNKSRAHTNTYTKGLSAGALAAPIVGNFLSQQEETPKKGFKEGGQINMKYRPKMQTGGSQPKMQTAGFPPKSEDYMDDYEGYQSAMDNWVQSTYDPEAQGLKGLKDFLGRRQKGLPTNMFKTTGNEGTDSNPMDRGPVETGPVETSPDQKETSKIDPYWAFRGLRSGTSWLSGMVERGRQNRYDWMQQTALGQMNPMPTDDFQPNPYNLYMQKGGNLKTIIKDYNKYTNDAQMDMGDGKLDDKGRMQKGGRAPIYTDNPNDPRLRAYNDSLSLYNNYDKNRNIILSGNKFNINPEIKPPYLGQNSTGKVKKPNPNNPITLKRINKDFAFNEISNTGLPEIEASYNKKIKPTATETYTRKESKYKTEAEYDKAFDKIKSFSEGAGQANWIGYDIQRYKKPVQPIVYQKPQGQTLKNVNAKNNSYTDSLTLSKTTSYLPVKGSDAYAQKEIDDIIKNGRLYGSDIFDDPKVRAAAKRISKTGNEYDVKPMWTKVGDKYMQTFKKPVGTPEPQEPKFEKPIPIPRKTDLVDFSNGRMPTPSAPDLQQAVYDNTKPTNYSYTYPTGKYNEQKVIYFPDENLLRNFADKQATTSIQSTGNQATATGTLKMKKGGYEIDKMMIMGNILPKLLQMGRLGTSKYRRMKEGGLTANKAREILHDGTVHGKKLTDKQRRYFGAMSKGHTNFRGK